MFLHISIFFFFNDTATTEIYTLSLHDALPIFNAGGWYDIFLQDTIANYTAMQAAGVPSKLLIGPWSHDAQGNPVGELSFGDRKSTRLNSSHLVISYAVFCLKKKKRYKN